jgi:hypothetical protein
MVQWLNYEDPAQRTSFVSAEGGYLWNHGGPYDARERLSDMFGSMVSEILIEEAAEEVEAEGITEWASTKGDDENELLTDAPPSLDDFSDEPSATYGSSADLDARKHALKALDEL